jgi:hypothetical protein
MPSHKNVVGRKLAASSGPRLPVQLQFKFMETMPLQLSPAAEAREFAAPAIRWRRTACTESNAASTS